MADTTEMNEQITDAVTQANLLAGGSAPAHAVGHSAQAMAHSTGLSFQNVVAAQQQTTVQSNTAAVLWAQQLLTLGTAESGAAASILDGSSQSPFSPQPQRRRARRPGRRSAGRP